MKITLDHNCIINLERKTDIGKQVKTIITNPINQCFIVNIGASEMRKQDIKPEHYELFEELLAKLQIEHLPKLDPMAIFDVTFFNRCIFANEEMVLLAQKIETILFGNSQPIDISKEGLESQSGRKWLNRMCDVHTMWRHIYYANEIFLTTDQNFRKETKLPKLIDLGVRRICHPSEI